MIKPVLMFGIMFILAGSDALLAATVVEVQSKNNLMTVLTDGKLARINMPDDEYAIIDYQRNTVKFVSPQKQQVMQLNANKMVSGVSSPAVRTSFNNLGAGIAVAGYPTQKYAYTANGKSCGIIYASKDVYQKEGIKELFRAMQTMMEKQRAILGGLAGMIDDCTLADMKVSEYVKNIGVPMRTENNGRIETEIKSIRYDITVPDDSFAIPSSYKTVTMQDQINAAVGGMMQAPRQSSQRAQGHAPKDRQAQMLQMMQQLQQSGRMTPEMMDQMRQAQEMMRQYQQPAH